MASSHYDEQHLRELSKMAKDKFDEDQRHLLEEKIYEQKEIELEQNKQMNIDTDKDLILDADDTKA